MRELRGPETVFIFQNARDAVDGERLLKAKGVQVRVMPLPVEISGSCGICLRVDAQ
ncbi:MAG: DUF3343 domain-containing protein, partial [Clostridiales Family XIII bacterium]|nr:DUF3343 domain-containing protein [Clostridiales Family XIII bacterium]